MTTPGLFEYLDSHLSAHRERLFPPAETLSMFLAQALSADGSCRGAVDQAATFRLLSGLPACSTATGGYCRARARLPTTLIQQLTRLTADWVDARTAEAWRETYKAVTGLVSARIDERGKGVAYNMRLRHQGLFGDE